MLADIDLDNIERAAKQRSFTHPADTLKLVAEVRRLRANYDLLFAAVERLPLSYRQDIVDWCAEMREKGVA